MSEDGGILGDGNTFKISNLMSAQEYSINVKIENKSTITTAYRIYANYELESDHSITDYDIKNIMVGNQYLSVPSKDILLQNWMKLDAEKSPTTDFSFTISTPTTYGNKNTDGKYILPDESLYEGDWSNETSKSGLKIKVVVEAYQISYFSASLGDKYYTSVNDAIKDAGNGDTIVLSKDTSEPIAVSGKSITLDLNGKNVVMSKPGKIAIKVGPDGDLTITGNGFVDGGSGGSNIGVCAFDGGKVLIKGGTFTVGADAEGQGNSVIYSQNGNILIEGGYFYTDSVYNGKHYVLNQNNGSPGTITVNGGTFVDYDPSKGDDSLKGNFVADGYSVNSEVKDNHTLYTVTKNQ